MNIQSAFSSGVTGFQRAQQQVTQSANNIAQQTVTQASGNPEASTTNKMSANATQYEAGSQQSLISDLVNLRVAEHQGKASAKVISAADEMIGSIIDIKV